MRSTASLIHGRSASAGPVEVLVGHPRGSLHPSALMFWQPTRTEVTRMDFDARG